uniref:Uncharacterized protein LOC114326468 n=1 Tax=Diabrotica virgifera virgifera TaxID=50390 RepID=A0A6P7F735_DIAVI
MSLLPQLKQLTPVRNMQMRVNIQQLFLNEQIYLQSGFGQVSNPQQATVPTPQISPCTTATSGSTGASVSQPINSYSTEYPEILNASSNSEQEGNAARYFHSFT